MIRRAAFLVALTLSAFASAQPPAPEPAPAPPQVPEVSDPMLEPIGPADRELKSFEQARDFINAKSPDLAQARADVERARGVYRQAFAGVLPIITGTASITGKPLQTAVIPGTAPPPYSYLMQIVTTEHVIAPSTWELMRADEIDESRAQLSEDDIRRRVYGGVAEAVLATAVAERTAELGRDGLRAALETYSIYQKRKELGAGAELDLARLAQDVANARLAVVEQNEAVRRAREGLGIALGYSDAWGVSASIDSAGVEQSLHRFCKAVQKLDERADIASAESSLQVSEKLVKKAELDFIPTVDLVTTVGMQPSSFLATSPGANFTIAGVLTWSIWDGGYRYGSLRIARANVTSANANLEQTRLHAGIETTQAGRAVSVALEALSAAEEARRQARETDRLVRVALSNGVGSTLDLVQAQAGVRRAEVEVALREFTVVRARIQQYLVSARCSL